MRKRRRDGPKRHGPNLRWLRSGLPAGVPNTGARFDCRGVDAAVAPEGAALPTTIPQGRCVGDIALQQLIAVAFGTQRRHVSGGPQWIREQSFQLYHIDAKAADPAKATSDHLRQMLQSLLAARFKLTVHREKRQSQEYVPAGRKRWPEIEASPHTSYGKLGLLRCCRVRSFEKSALEVVLSAYNCFRQATVSSDAMFG